MPTSLRAIAEKASTTGPVRKRTVLKSPVRENCTPGSVRGRSGDWPTYLDGNLVRMNTEKRILAFFALLPFSFLFFALAWLLIAPEHLYHCWDDAPPFLISWFPP